MAERDINAAANMLGVEYDLKHNIVINCPIPSLHYLSQTKVAIFLWKSHLNKAKFTELAMNCEYRVVKNMQPLILDSISNLMIPRHSEELLRSLIESMGNEIYSNFLEKKLSTFQKYGAYLQNLCFTQQGTFDILKTAIKIIEESNLSTLEKYELACDFCLREKIRELRKSLSDIDIKNLEDKETFSLPAFWSFYMKDEQLPSLIKGVKACDYLRKCITDVSQNEIAIHFIWENFADESWKKQLLHVASTVLCSQRDYYPTLNIVLYFCMHMNQDQLRKINDRFHERILEKLHTIAKWNNLVSLTEYVCAFINIKQCIRGGFSIIEYCWFWGNFLKIEDLTTIWNAFVLRFQLDLEREIVPLYNHLYLDMMQEAIFKMGIIASLFFEVANPEDRKKMIYGRTTMVFCERLLSTEGQQTFDLFLKKILQEKDISHFKKEFFKVSCFTLCSGLVCNGNYAFLDKILIENLTYEKVNEFKRNHCHNILIHVLKRGRKWIFLTYYDEGELVSVMRKYFSWCFNDDEEEMERYKTLIFDVDSVLYDDIKKTFFNILMFDIKFGIWNAVTEYCKWILSANKKYATDSNGKFIICKKLLFATYGEESSSSYLQNKNCHGLLRRFITTCFNQDEVKKLKEELPNNVELSLLVRELIIHQNIPEVEDILKWSFSSVEKNIADFKSTFMNVSGCSLVFYFLKHDDNIKRAESVLKWFSPSLESAEWFKEHFLTYLVDNYMIPSLSLIRRDAVTEEKKNKWKVITKQIHDFLSLLNLDILHKQGFR